MVFHKIYFYIILSDMIIYTSHFHIIIWQYIVPHFDSIIWHAYIVKVWDDSRWETKEGVKYYALKAYSLLSSVIFVDSLGD